MWTFDNEDTALEGGRSERRETLLWDLAGQPGYRLVHQLHLNDVSVAMVVFDAKSEVDPFAGVRHWSRALSTAAHPAGTKLKRILVAARSDRGGTGVGPERAK